MGKKEMRNQSQENIVEENVVEKIREQDLENQVSGDFNIDTAL